MGRRARYTKDGLDKGAWTAQEDQILTHYVKIYGEGKWSNVSKLTDLKRCGKSCRLRWMNYLRPDIKRGNISHDEAELIIRLHKLLGNRWSLIAGRLPGRTDNEIKNYWNTNLAKKSQEQVGIQERAPLKSPTNKIPTTLVLLNHRPSTSSNKVITTRQQQSQGDQRQDHQNYQELMSGPCQDPNLQKPVLQQIEGTQSAHGNGTPSSAAGGENPLAGLGTDFNLEDFCKILDDAELAEFAAGVHIADADHHHHDHDHDNTIEVIKECAAKQVEGIGSSSGGKKMNDDDHEHHDDVEADLVGGLDFLSLISFLDPVPAEWADDDDHLNIVDHVLPDHL